MTERVWPDAADAWSADEELQRMERLTEIWESHADMHQGTAYGAAITNVARGYRLQLEAVRQAERGSAR